MAMEMHRFVPFEFSRGMQLTMFHGDILSPCISVWF
jgi:hypothetical protein